MLPASRLLALRCPEADLTIEFGNLTFMLGSAQNQRLVYSSGESRPQS